MQIPTFFFNLMFVIYPKMKIYVYIKSFVLVYIF